MPTYIYEEVDPEGRPGARFEVRQSFDDPSLTHHPETGNPVRRVLTPPNIAGSWSDMKTKGNLSPSNLERLGFTQYKKAGDGKYEKTAGPGPSVISRGDSGIE